MLHLPHFSCRSWHQERYMARARIPGIARVDAISIVKPKTASNVLHMFAKMANVFRNVLTGKERIQGYVGK